MYTHIYLISLIVSREFIVAMEDHITSDVDLLSTLSCICQLYNTSFSSENRYQASKVRKLMGIIDEVSIDQSAFCSSDIICITAVN